MNEQQRKAAVEAARGLRAPDLLVENVRLINVYTGEIYPAVIAIHNGYFVHVGKPGWKGEEPLRRLDGGGRLVMPGMIDAHVHIESSMMTPEGFAAAVLPRGTTTVVIDPHEIGNVLGLRGVKMMLDATRDLPLRVFAQAPSCVPSVPGMETAGADFGAEEIRQMLGWERVIGLAEVMDYVGVIQQQERMARVVGAALERGTVISGHCRELTGQDLSAYLVGGPNSDHEGDDVEELRQKLRNGMVIEGRVSSFRSSMAAIQQALEGMQAFPLNLVLCTDDIFPDDLLGKGHMDRVIREGLEAGLDARDLVRAATLHAALRHRLHELGAVAPGKKADFLILDSLEPFCVADVYVGGVHVASQGKMCQPLASTRQVWGEENTVKFLRPLQREDFLLKAEGKNGRKQLRVLTIAPNLNRWLEEIQFPLKNGSVDYAADEEVCLTAIFERHARNGNRSLSLVKGFGLRQGAMASTVAHDCHNLVVVGRNAEDMLLAAQTLAECGGGFCAVQDGKVKACLPLPVGGLMSPLPPENMLAQFEHLNSVLREMGLKYAQPLTGILGLALPVIPPYGITDMGLVDVEKQQFVPVMVD